MTDHSEDNVVFDLARFDEYREDNRREVKTAKENIPVSLWDTYSSFSNTYGGVIILGVKEREDGSWYTTGLKNVSKQRKQFWDTINNKTKVSINLLTEKNLETYEVNGDVIMVIYVPAAPRVIKPVYINNDLFGGTFKRDGEGDYHCTELQVKAMLRDQTEETYDMKVLTNMSLADLNYETVHSYRTRHQLLHGGHPFEGYTDEEYLRSIGAAAFSDEDGKLHPTGAGLLMFGNEYNIVRQFPEYFLDYREMLDPTIRWTDRVQSSSGDWSGNLCDFYFRVYNKIQKDLKVPFSMAGGDRIDDTPVHKAVREALANCLINADYFGKYGVLIKKENDVLTLENPGCIRVGKKQMLLGGISDPRNKALMKMFNLINIGERAGSGVPNILQTWDREEWVTPEVDEQYHPDRTVLRLSFKRKSDDHPDNAAETTQSTTQSATQSKTTQSGIGTTQSSSTKGNRTPVANAYTLLDAELSIINLMKKHPEYSQSGIAKELQMDLNLVKYYVRKLRQMGAISREGTSRSGFWKVNI